MGRTRKVTGRSTPSKAESPQKPVRRGRRGRSSVEPESESNDRIEDEVDENLAKSESESNGDSDYESLATKKKRSSRSTKAKQPELPKRITRRRSSRRDDSDNESRETAEVLDSRNDSSEQMQTITEEQDEEKSKEIDVKPIEQESHGEIVVVQEAEDEQQMKQDKAVSEVSVQDNENDESKENAQEKEESEAKSPEKQDKVDDEPEKETPMECEQPENPVADQLPKGADECEPSNKENVDQKDDTDVVKPKNSHANDLKSQTHANEEPESLQIIENPKDPQEIEKPKSPPPAQYEKEDGEVVEEDVEAVENTKKREIEEKAEEKSPEKKPIEVKKPIQRKRRWLTNKPDSKPSVITISTDSLKNIIAEPVRPVPLSDVRLESSPEPEVQVIIDESPKEKRRSKDIKEKPKSVDKENIEEAKVKAMEKTMGATRKISIVSDDGLNNKIQRPPTPPKHHQSNILYITNLVRPFTVLQLKGLLARTGKIVENGFWIDKIKSKCYVKYENEDEAVETRHALHGVTWPPSNPKCLNVDFSNDQSMEKAIISTLDEHQRVPVETSRDNKDFGWSKENSVKNERDAVKEPQRIVREWDLGKKNDFDRDHENERRREKERVDRRDLSRDRKRDDRRRSNERGYSRERRRSATESPARKFKKEDEPPIRLLDDLFRKTKATPCIYWLPLTDEQIAEKEEMRRKSMAEHQRRMEERKKLDEEREKEREKRRERERERDRERERERRRSGSRGRRRSGSRGHSRDRDRRRHR